MMDKFILGFEKRAGSGGIKRLKRLAGSRKDVLDRCSQKFWAIIDKKNPPEFATDIARKKLRLKKA